MNLSLTVHVLYIHLIQLYVNSFFILPKVIKTYKDLLQSLAAKIYSLPEMHDRFIKAKLDFSAFGLGVSIENAAPVTDIENAIERMLDQIKESGKRLLITVDENSEGKFGYEIGTIFCLSRKA